MSDTASDYNLPKLQAGIIVAGAASLAAFSASFSAIRIRNVGASILPLAYGVMLFASSYVEEEHHFWYWVSSAWILWLFFALYDIISLRILASS